MTIPIIVGPTGSGKSDYAIRLAHEIGGEIISADSRQVYRGMDIGTGKVTRDLVAGHPEHVERSSKYEDATAQGKAGSSTRRLAQNDTPYYSGGIRHHLLDVASPKRTYTVTHFLRDAKAAITDIRKRGKVPIICGGTNFWIEALVFDTAFPEVKPDPALRKQLGRLTAPELFTLLAEKDPDRAETIDRHNKVRLIRALEIVATLGKVPKTGNSGQIAVNKERETGDGIRKEEEQIPLSPPFRKGETWKSTQAMQSGFLPFTKGETWKSTQAMRSGFLPFTKGVPSPRGEGFSPSEFQFFGIDLPKDELHERIQKRLKKRLEKGMIDEVKRLHEQDGLSWKRLDGFGLEYRWCARFLQGKIPREDMEASLLKESFHYAKRQMTFLRRLERKGLRIEWRHD